jgi:outer membrane protein OmpA-like peptidoglycan-associated protein
MSETAQETSEDDDHRSLDASGVGVILLAVLFLALAVLSARVEGGGTSASGWLDGVRQNLAGRGYDWMRIDVTDGVATVSGEAPDVDSRQIGFEAAETAIENADAADTVKLVIDATSLEGAERSVGAALAALSPTPSASDCSAAFASTLEGRTINFESASATLSADNRRLLDALAGVATRCRAHRIEIGGHTDRRGRADANAALSQSRAEAVRTYLTDKGVPAEGLDAHGYGATRPRDRASGSAADAANRRIEFTVTDR